jgi:hypothetical protein
MTITTTYNSICSNVTFIYQTVRTILKIIIITVLIKQLSLNIHITLYPSSSNPHYFPSDIPSSELPILQSNHPCDYEISADDILHIQKIFSLSSTLQEQTIPFTNNSSSSPVSYRSIADLLSHDCPINDTIIQSFLILIRNSNENIKFVDTNFSYYIKQHGWGIAYNFFFSTKIAHCMQKP